VTGAYPGQASSPDPDHEGERRAFPCHPAQPKCHPGLDAGSTRHSLRPTATSREAAAHGSQVARSDLHWGTMAYGLFWRRRADSNRCIRVLQTLALTTWQRRPLVPRGRFELPRAKLTTPSRWRVYQVPPPRLSHIGRYVWQNSEATTRTCGSITTNIPCDITYDTVLSGITSTIIRAFICRRAFGSEMKRYPNRIAPYEKGPSHLDGPLLVLRTNDSHCCGPATGRAF
jgi:hypothetical protein